MMIGLGQVQDFCAVAGAIKDATALSDLMAEITKAMGFRHYALVHHVDLKPAVRSVHIVDYPQDWVERFQARRLYASDPIHRASHRTNVGFAWSAVQSIISLTAADRSILAEA
ncbi:autoinducer binding domain-containing protein [Sphingobium limneticum]|nr:autoinducer binding domain-containing protein [Sphingobium limneticum]